MASKTDIANHALMMILGETQIESITDTSSKAARVMGLIYPQAQDAMLSMCRWGPAKKQATLSKLSTVPTYKWLGAYPKPTDFIRLVEIDKVDSWLPEDHFDELTIDDLPCIVTGDAESSDEAADTIDIEYIWRNEDPTTYTPLMVEALTYVLAMKAAKTLTGSDSLRGELRQEFERIVLPQAMTIDLQQRHSGENHPIRKFLTSSHLSRARRAGDASHVGLDDW